MGYSTDFLGQLEIRPVLNAHEVEYLTAFAESRRWDRPGGPYAVPDNPRLDDTVVLGPVGEDGLPSQRSPVSPSSVDTTRFSRIAPGQPQLYCQWVPCPRGCCLSWDGREKFYRPTRWLRYIIEHLLADGAHASRSGDPQFEEFGFDHRVDGVVAACRRDTRRLWTIEVNDNVVTERDLVPGLDEWRLWGPFPHEEEADRSRRPARRRRVGSVGAVVRAVST